MAYPQPDFNPDPLNRFATPGVAGTAPRRSLIDAANIAPTMTQPSAPKPNAFGDAASAAVNPGMQVAQPRPTAASAIAGANDAAMKYSGFPLTADQQAKVGARFESNQNATAAAAAAASKGMPWYPGIGESSAPSMQPGTNSQPQGFAGPPDLSQLPSAPAAAPPPPAPAAAPAATGLVSRIGNSYSGTNVAGNINVNGQAPGGGYMEGGGGGSLVQRAFSQSPAAQPPQYQAPQVANSGNDWESRNNLRNLEVSASSITNNGGRFDSRRGRINGPSLAQAAYLDAGRADLAARGQQAGLENSTNQINSNLQREGMQQEGLQQRSLVQAALEQQRINQAGVTAGYANRAAAQTEQIRNGLMTETDPAKRRSLVETMLAMEGKQSQADPYLVVPGGQQVDQMGKAYSMPSSVFNRQTGQFVQQQQSSANSPSENHVAWLRKNPSQAANFDQIYGAGAAKRVLG